MSDSTFATPHAEALAYAKIVVREAEAYRFDAPKTEMLARALLALSSETGRIMPTPEMLAAGEVQYLSMMNPGARDFASNPFGRALVEAIYNAMEATRVRR